MNKLKSWERVGHRVIEFGKINYYGKNRVHPVEI